MNFGKGIFIAFVLFAMFMATLVVVCVKQDVSLVTQNYYQEELQHQHKIDKIINGNELSQKPLISFQKGEMQISFTDFKKIDNGQLNVMRPSNPSLDENFSLKASDNNLQSFKLSRWQPGLYRVSMTWKMGEKEYFIEKMMVL